MSAEFHTCRCGSKTSSVWALAAILVLCSPLCGAAENAGVRCWEPPNDKTMDFDHRASWKLVSKPGQTSSMVLENEYLLAWLKTAEHAVTVYAKGESSGPTESAALCFLAPGSEKTLAIRAIQLTETLSNYATVQLQMDNGIEVRMTLRARRAFVDCDPKSAITASVSTGMKVAFRPDFFATDVILHPSLSIFKTGKASLPLSNYLFGAVNDNTAVGMAWSGNARRVVLMTTGEGHGAVFNRVSVDSDGDCRDLHVGFLKAPGAFQFHDLRDVAYNQEMKHKKGTVKQAVLEKTWKPPAPARWGVLMLHGERKPLESPFQPVSRNWLLQGVVGNKDGTVSFPLHKPGKLWQAAKWSWGVPTQRGAVFDGRQKLTLCLEERFGPYTCAVCYPMARWDDTLGDFVTIADFVSEALGPKAMEEVFDLPGLKPRWTGADLETTAVASCGACEELSRSLTRTLPMTDEGKKKAREDGARIASYLKMMSKRAAEYLEFAKALKILCESEKNSTNAHLAARIQEEISVIDQEWASENRGTGLDEQAIGSRVGELLMDLEAWPEDIDKRIRKHGNFLATRMGNAVDSFVSKANLSVQRIVQTAMLCSGQDKEGQAFARSVLARAHAVLRHRHHMEEHLIECKDRAPLPNPARLEEAKP